MTTPNTIAETMNKAHSHGAHAEKAHPSRADRPTSFNLDDIAVPHGREEDWRFTPMRRIEKLFETQNVETNLWACVLMPPKGSSLKKLLVMINVLVACLRPETVLRLWHGTPSQAHRLLRFRRRPSYRLRS